MLLGEGRDARAQLDRRFGHCHTQGRTCGGQDRKNVGLRSLTHERLGGRILVRRMARKAWKLQIEGQVGSVLMWRVNTSARRGIHGTGERTSPTPYLAWIVS